MNELMELATTWYDLPLGALIFMLTFGFAPGMMLRLLVLIYPKGDPRRQELIAELYVLRRLERLLFVGEQMETAFTEGIALRYRWLRGRRTKKRRRKLKQRKALVMPRNVDNGLQWRKSSASRAEWEKKTQQLQKLTAELNAELGDTDR